MRRHTAVPPLAMLAIALGGAVGANGGAVGANTQQREQVPVFRARTDLVQIDATVRDGNGDPVKGLRAEDLAVFDNGTRVMLDVVPEVEGRTFEGAEVWKPLSIIVSTRSLTSAGSRVVVLTMAGMRTPGLWDLRRQLVR